MVIAVKAMQTFDTPFLSVKKEDIRKAGNETWKTDLGLPQTVDVSYAPSFSNEAVFTDTPGQYSIVDWKLPDGKMLTLDYLQTSLESLTSLALTPVYADASNSTDAGLSRVPEWATVKDVPTFTLTVGDRTPVAVKVQTPGDIIYGGSLENPVVTQEQINGGGTDSANRFTFTYKGYSIGPYGNRETYSSAQPPRDVGEYQVVATLISSTHSGAGVSGTFKISPRPVTVSGTITGVDREYDGRTGAALDFSRVTINGKISGDEVSFSASGSFADKNAGVNKPVTITDTSLQGRDRNNYTLDIENSSVNAATTATINRRTLTLNAGRLKVVKPYDGTTSPGTLEGWIASSDMLTGVVDGEYIYILSNSGKPIVGVYADKEIGRNKTVVLDLSQVRLTDNVGNVKNYALVQTFTLTNAEITKAWPRLGEDFRVEIPGASYDEPTKTWQISYDGSPHGASIAAPAAGLGTATFTYTRLDSQGRPDSSTKTERPPVDLGSYRVTVSFQEGDSFAEMTGSRAIAAGTLTIGRSTAADASVTIAVSAGDTERTVRLSSLGLAPGMAEGAAIKVVPSVSDGGILSEVLCEAGGDAFTLRMKENKSGTSQSFTLVLSSGNYDTLNVGVTVAVEEAVTVKGGTFVYGTPLGDIAVPAGSGDTLAEPDRIYGAGQYQGESVLLRSGGTPVVAFADFEITRRPVTVTVSSYTSTYYFGSSCSREYRCEITAGSLAAGDSIEDLVRYSEIAPTCGRNLDGVPVGTYQINAASTENPNYDLTVVPGTLTVRKVTDFDAGPFMTGGSPFYVTVFANDAANNSEQALMDYITTRMEGQSANRVGYTGGFDDVEEKSRGSVFLKPLWEKAGGPAYDRRGSGVSAWYQYSAALTTKDESIAENFDIPANLKPRAQVMVVPVKADQSAFSPSTRTVTKSVLAGLTEANWKTGLGLPGEVDIACQPAAEGDYRGPTRISQAISGWMMDGKLLTLERLMEKVQGASGGNAEITLTPVYATEGSQAVPDWLTLQSVEARPKLILTFTDRIPVEVQVTPPQNITYGETLQPPSAVQVPVNGGTVDPNPRFTYRYVKTDGTEVTGTPCDADTYRVIATLDSSTHSGQGISDTFTIHRKRITFSGITVKDKVYDGTGRADLDTSKLKIEGILPQDQGKVVITFWGGFNSDWFAGSDRKATINPEMSGEKAHNYTIQNQGASATITRRPLEIDDSSLEVIKGYDGTADPPAGNAGVLRYKGLVESDQQYFYPNLSYTVGRYDTPNAGKNKTVTLSNIQLLLTPSGYNQRRDSYQLPETYTFRRAEITAKPFPKIGTDYTVTGYDGLYDGTPHAAEVTALGGAQLGVANFIYVKGNEPMSSGSGTAPEDVGTYRVYVYFGESTQFAAMGEQSAVCVGDVIRIRKDYSAASLPASVTVPADASGYKVLLSDLAGLAPGVTRDAKLLSAPSISGGGALAAVTGTTGENYITLDTGNVAEPRTETLTVQFNSESYAQLTVTVAVTVTPAEVQITWPVLRAKGSSFPYGTPLKDILALSGGSFRLGGAEVPGRFTLTDAEKTYAVGNYQGTTFEICFDSNNGRYHESHWSAAERGFTIQKAPVTEFSPIEQFRDAPYYITVYASDPDLAAGGPAGLVKSRKGFYIAKYNNETLNLDADWTADPKNSTFQYKGDVENIWYTYNADLSLENYEVKISKKPQALLRVLPVVPVELTLPAGNSSRELAKLLIDRADFTIEDLGLPGTAAIKFTAAPGVPAANIQDAGSPKDGEYTIKEWTLDGKKLTLANLRSAAAGLAAGERREIKLTPVYASSSLPGYATGGGTPKLPAFTLTVTEKVPIPDDWVNDSRETGILGLTLEGTVAGIKWNGEDTPAALYAACYDAKGRLISIRAADTVLEQGINTVAIPDVSAGGELRLFLASDSIPLCGAWSNQQASGPR